MKHKYIESAQNPVFKSLLRLKSDPGERRQSASLLLEGIHLCTSWIQAGLAPTQWILEPEAENHKEIIPLLQQVQAPRLYLSRQRLQELSEHPHPAGLMAIAPLPGTPQPASRHAVIMDRIQDPGNLGTLLRTAAAAGVYEIFLLPGCADPYSLRCLRAGMGAQAQLNLRTVTTEISHTTPPWQPRHLRVTCLQDSTSLYQSDLSAPGAWLFGNEGQGASLYWLQQAHTRIHIPTSNAVESLNVAAAAAICLFEQRRCDLLQADRLFSG